jgi:glycosyltransferase involved in cell wall biosynthesis
MEDAWRIAASAEIGVSPFYPDRVFNVASPTKLIESMALGVPPVANRQPEQSAVLAASGAGLCVEWGAQEFASAICWLLDHPDEARTMCEKGVQWVAAHRTYPIVAARVWEVYRTVLGEKP